MITREQVRDLREGDVVEVTDTSWTMPVTTRGVLYNDPSDRSRLCLGAYYIRIRTEPGPSATHLTLTVIERAPRPLYVNHDRAEPVPKDVVLAPDGNGDMQVWICIKSGGVPAGRHNPPQFIQPTNYGMLHALPAGDRESRMCQPWRLLVDGETGQVVQ